MIPAADWTKPLTASDATFEEKVLDWLAELLLE